MYRKSRYRSITSIPKQSPLPVRWNVRLIERFMLVFGPVSSLFDFLTFYTLLALFGAGEALFQTGWFIELMTTQILVVFAIRTRRPFFRSRPRGLLVVMALVTVAVAMVLPALPESARGSASSCHHRCSLPGWWVRHWRIWRLLR